MFDFTISNGQAILESDVVDYCVSTSVSKKLSFISINAQVFVDSKISSIISDSVTYNGDAAPSLWSDYCPDVHNTSLWD